MQKVFLTIVGAVALASCFGSPAAASTFTYASTGISNPDQFIDFSGLADSTPINSTYAGSGATFSGLVATSAYGSRFTPTTAPAAVNFGPISPGPFEIDFSSPVSDISFYVVTDGAGTTVSSYFAGVPVESLSFTSYNGANDFFGFTNTQIDQVVFTVSGDHAALIDNVAFSNVAAVPEPMSLVALGAGLAGLAVSRRRKRG